MDALKSIEHMYDPCPTTGCYLWLGFITQGYGRIGVNKKYYRAHRYTWMLAGNELPQWPLVLDHVCNNKACVNPDHLRVATHRQNILRGNAPSAANAAKTHCIRGHALEGDNVRFTGHSRWCRACDRERNVGNEKRREANRVRIERKRQAFIAMGLTGRGTPRKNKGYGPSL